MQLTPTIELLRLDKPIGIWLLFIPAAVGVLLSPIYRWELLPVMLLGALLMRSAGCIINDLTDRTLDIHVARTRTRPLASGTLSRGTAFGLLAVLMALALGLALLLPRQVVYLALLAVPLIVAYPWMKRITWWPQLFLGLTFNFGLLIGWAATGAPLGATAYLAYAACVFWTLGYDTIYAVQDIHDDAVAGIRSTARRVSARLLEFITLCYGAMLGLWMLVFMGGGFGHALLLGIVAAALHACWQLLWVKELEPEQAGPLFRSNQWLGLALLTGLALDRLTDFIII